MKNIIAFILGFTGFLLLVGSAGDCDGACMDQANSMSEILLLCSLGFGCMFLSFLMFNKRG